MSSVMSLLMAAPVQRSSSVASSRMTDTPPSGSGRPKRSTAGQVNYAEAVEDTTMKHGSGGGGSGSSRKRNASASPAGIRIRTPKSIMKQLMASVTKKNLDNSSSSTMSGKKIAHSLDFGTAKKKTIGPSPRYVTNFVIACEQICLRDDALLSAYHKEVAKLLPIIPTDLDNKIRPGMERVLTKRVVERIEAQLHALGPHGSPDPHFLLKSAHNPTFSTCSAPKCRTERSFLMTICSECRKKDGLKVNPVVDWREAVLKQRELDAFDAAQSHAKALNASAKKKAAPKASSKKKKQSEEDEEEDEEELDAETDSSSASSASSASPSAYIESSSTKRRKTPTAASSPTISSAPTPPTKFRASSDLDSIPMPDAAWILKAREDITLRAIQWLRVCMAKAKNHEFSFHGGDIIFLLRNAIFKARGEVSKQADIVVREMIARWDSTTLTIISDSSEPSHILVYSECLHAKKEMRCGSDQEIKILCERVRSALTNHCAEDILRFDASQYRDSLPHAAYCYPCGVFHSTLGRTGSCPECGGELRMEPDFEFLCESLVWVSLFQELGISPVRTADATVELGDILALMRSIRPYGSLHDRGTDSYKLMCYFITHLTFVMTRWGATCMSPRTLFVEEYLFLLSNMDVVIKAQDPELVGEFLQALHILDTPHDSPVMQKGYHFLLTHEKKGKMRGNWMLTSDEFYKKYHAGYCGIIGAAEFKFDPDLKFDTRYNHYFE